MIGTLFVLTAVQMVGAGVCYGLARRGTWGAAAAMPLGFVGFMFSLMTFSEVVFFSYCLVLVAGLACLGFRARLRTFFGVSCGAVLLIWFVILGGTVRDWRELRTAYPIESLRARLERPMANADAATTWTPAALDAAPEMTQATIDRLAKFEDQLSYRPHYKLRREEALRVIHSSAVEQFAASPGFGVGRMPRITPASLNERPSTEPLPQPEGTAPYVPQESPGQAVGQLPLAGAPIERSMSRSEAELETLHLSAAVNFVNPDGFGYFRSTDYVVGFEPHAFREEQAYHPGLLNREQWQVDRVELVSLLLHVEPAIYVSENLPRMQDVRNLPLRPLDDFERDALARLVAGEDLVVGTAEHAGQMLGSLRAAQRCAECHEVPRGTLLGAFSYRLRLPSGRPTALQATAAAF